jgi:hypothetical protein
VFYNFLLKCFVLIDLKIGRLEHQDVGQMDMYLRMFDQLKRGVGDNPTVGLILCAEKDEVVARYSILHENQQMFASKYMLYLPSEEELRRELARERDQIQARQQSERKPETAPNRWVLGVFIFDRLSVAFFASYAVNLLPILATDPSGLV